MFAPEGKQYIVRTVSISGRVKDVLNFVQEEFTDSLQTAKKRIKKGGVLVAVHSEEDAAEHVEYYLKHGLKASYELEDELW
jgi:spore maturation protein CgeB